MSRFSWIAPFALFLLVLPILAYGFVITLVDSNYYQAFARFLTTGDYPYFPPSFTFTTISPPLYSGLLALVSGISHGHVLLLSLQVAMLLGSTLLLYSILTVYLGRLPSFLYAVMFLIIPGNIIYAQAVMTEIPAQFLLTLVVFLTGKWLKSKRHPYLALAAGVALFSGLMKYSLMVYGVLISLLLLYATVRTKKGTFIALFFPVSAATLVLGWVIWNRSLTGVWGLSDSIGVHLYDQAVWIGGLAPGDPSHPDLVTITNTIPQQTSFRNPHWMIEPYFVNQKKWAWKPFDEMLGRVARQAIIDHPVRYGVNTVKVFLMSFRSGAPYDAGLRQFGNEDLQHCWTIDRKTFCTPLYRRIFCDRKAYSTIIPCTPLIRTPETVPVFVSLVRYADSFYDRILPIFSYAVFLPSVALLLLIGKSGQRLYPLLFLMGTFPQAALERPEARYLIPYYPLMVISTGIVLRIIIQLLQRITQSHRKSVIARFRTDNSRPLTRS